MYTFQLGKKTNEENNTEKLHFNFSQMKALIEYFRNKFIRL